MITHWRTLKLFGDSDSLLSRCVKSGSILGLGGLFESAMRFSRNMILARLLAPEAFGLMATVIASVAALEALAEVGFRQVVIQNKRGAEPAFLNVIWWFSTGRGLLLYAAAFALAPLVSSFFGKPESETLLRIGCLVVIFNGLISPRVHVLEKQLQFKRWVLLMQGTGIITVMITVAAAFFLPSVWALLIGYMAEATIRSLLSFIICPFKPELRFDRSCAREIRNYSKRIFGLPILMIIFSQMDVFVIGKVISIDKLGMYVLAKGLAEMPGSFIVSKIIQPVILPSLSIIQEDTARLRKAILSITRLLVMFGLPLLLFLALFAKSVLSIAYGPSYQEVSLPFAFLCTFALIQLCASIIMSACMAIGRPDIHRTASIVRTLVLLALIYPATTELGLIGTALAITLSTVCLLIMQLIYLPRVFSISVVEYFRSWFAGLALSPLLIIPAFAVSRYYFPAPITDLAIGAVLCLLSWGLAFLRMGWHRRERLPWSAKLMHE